MSIVKRPRLYLALAAVCYLSPFEVQGEGDGDLVERLHALERRVELLENRLKLHSPLSVEKANHPAEAAGKMNDNPLAPASTIPVVSTPAAIDLSVSSDQALQSGLEPHQALAQLFLFHDEGSLRPEQEPDAKGALPFDGTVTFMPRDYGLEDNQLMSAYDDPSLYPAIAVNLIGYWQVTKAGTYRLSILPKPAREGGSAVRGALIFSIQVDGQEVFPETTSASWKKIEKTMEMMPGLHHVTIWALAQTPGFGPSPTAAKLKLSVRGPGDASPRPLFLHAP